MDNASLAQGETKNKGLSSQMRRKCGVPVNQKNAVSPELDLTAVGGILNSKHRLGILRALKPCDKSLGGFYHVLGISDKLTRHHCRVLEAAGLLNSYKRKVWGVNGSKESVVYGLTELGRDSLEAYDIN